MLVCRVRVHVFLVRAAQLEADTLGRDVLNRTSRARPVELRVVLSFKSCWATVRPHKAAWCLLVLTIQLPAASDHLQYRRVNNTR